MLDALQARISESLIERDDEIRAVLLGLIAQEHVLFVGPPGTAKSLLCRSVAAGISGLRYCERLLSPTTAPEYIFGPPNLQLLREGRWEHVADGMVTQAELVFLDEFFRGSDAIRDTLLHLLGPERQAMIGTQQVHVPLRCAVAASNAWSDSADQAAILDRWLIRREVKRISAAGRCRLLRETLSSVAPVATLADLDAAHEAAMRLPVAPESWEALDSILAELSAAGIQPSDRRCRSSVKVAKAAAALDGAAAVAPHHLESLADVLWTDPKDHPVKAAEIVVKIANPTGAAINELLREVAGIVEAAGSDKPAMMAAVGKLQECQQRAEKLAYGGNGRAAKVLQHVKVESATLTARCIGASAEKIAAFLKGGA